MSNSELRPHLTPTGLSQYVALDNCDRYLRFYVHQGETQNLTKRLAKSVELVDTPWQPFQPLSPLLSEIGEKTEQGMIAQLQKQGHRVRDLGQQNPDEALATILQVIKDGQAHYFYQVPMRGKLGSWPFEGRADLVRIVATTEIFEVAVIDIKASRKDKVQHRLQVAVYVLMFEQMLKSANIGQVKWSGAIVRRTADGFLQDPANAVAFELAPYLSAVRYLAEGENSPLNRVAAAPDYKDLHYYLGPRCDSCNFSPICLTDTAERRDLSLIPFLNSSDKRILNSLNIHTLADLASLKKFEESEGELKEGETAPKKKLKLVTAPGQEQMVNQLQATWPLATRLDHLIQRAALNQRHFDKTTPAHRFFINRTRLGVTRRGRSSNLPDDKLYPDLIKIFIETNFDYLEERIYQLGALISCGQGEKRQEVAVVRTTKDIPTAESEQKLLLEWVAAIFEAVVKMGLAQDGGVRLHFYLYDRHDQKILLDAVRRHLDAFAALPIFYRLLTDTPTLTQPAIAFLHDEIHERMNLAGPLSSLAVVARQLGFDWQDAQGRNFAKIFRHGVFDYGLRRNDGVYIHATARFHSSVPLEYAYAAWNRLSQPARPYQNISLAQLEAFAAHRLKALAHIEASFPYKNSYLVKEPIALEALLNAPQDKPESSTPLAQVLEEFLHIEQFTNLQQHLELFTKPISRRMEEGRAILGRCTELETTELSRRRKIFHATFLAEFDRGNVEVQTALQVSKLKEGDFVVVTPLEEDGEPWKIVGGRLARIEEISGGWLKLELSGSTLGQGQRSAFKYFHARDLLPQPGQYYMIDEMVDNLNGDKLIEACRYANSNSLYRLAVQNELDNQANLENVATNTANSKFLDIVQAIESQQNRAPTVDQLNVISPSAEPLLLVQGPPGTGKSHTLGWAVLARIFQALQQSTDEIPTFRVIVSSQTHNAVEIVLQSIAQKWRQLMEYANATENPEKALQKLAALKIYKAGGDETAERAPEIAFLDPWYREGVKAALENDPTLLESKAARAKKAAPKKKKNAPEPEPPPPEPKLLVIGATPGNLYNLMKTYYGSGKTKQDEVWSNDAKFFDLLVLDEASQMNLPHALLAAGWLKPDGHTLIVGDHRQLAPILTHPWEHEEHLPTVSSRPYRSVFQFFLDMQRWRCIALSESFRLHYAQAEFLQQNIYRYDNIHFHSRQEKRLPPLDWSKSVAARNGQLNPAEIEFIATALHPDYPVIIIEHNEASSQQSNLVEADLISPIITAATNLLNLEGKDGVGIVVPHRAQKAALRERFPTLAKAGAIDTVERFQGGERDLILISTTASDPDYIAAEAEFLLSPNRFNVALSRPRAKLIVVAATGIFQFISVRLELFEQAILWKNLATLCQGQLLWHGTGADFSSKNLSAQPNLAIKIFGYKPDVPLNKSEVQGIV